MSGHESSDDGVRRPDNFLDDLHAWTGLASRQWTTMAGAWVLVMIAVVATILLWPRTYESTAKFLVRNARQDLVVTPSDASPAAYRDYVSEETLNSEIELLRSRDLLTSVVNDVHLVSATSDEDLDLAVQRTVRALNNGLDVHVIRKTNLIQVSYASRQPDLAASVVRHLVDGYLARHLVVHSSPGSYDFFKAQTDAARQELEGAEAELASLGRTADLVAPDLQRKAALDAVTTVQSQLETTAAEIKEHRSRLYSASDQLDQMEGRIVTQERTIPFQGSVDRLLSLITELRNKRTELQTKFNNNDRLIVEVDEQIATTERDLKAALDRNAKEQSTDVNPNWQLLRNEMQTATLAIAGLDAKQRALQEQLGQYRSRVLQVTEAEPQFEQRMRAVTVSRARYELFTKREDEARVADALDREKISNVVLAEAPVPSRVPSGPNRRLALLVGSIGASFIAFGVALVDDRRRYWSGITRPVFVDRSIVVSPQPARISESRLNLEG